MKQVFLALQAYLLASLGTSNGVTYVRLWNNQLQTILEGTEDDVALFSNIGETPALFIDFNTEQEIKQIGNKSQIYDPLTIRIHIIMQFFDTEDGNDLNIYDVAEAIYVALNDYAAPNLNLGSLVRTKELPDLN